jgi:hypothetical protein
MIEQMTPKLKKAFCVFSALMAEARIPFGLNEVLRTKKRQLAYACQGRTFNEMKALCAKFEWPKSWARIDKLLTQEGKTMQQICDIFRAEAGCSYLLHGKEWYKITQTLNSQHFAGEDGLSKAFDIKLFMPGQVPTWNNKWDADKNGIPEYEEAAKLGRLAGLKAGADFGDYPHYQLK